MAGRRTNLALFLLLGAAFATGWLAFGTGTGWSRWAVIAHALAGVAILLLAPWKSIIARRGVRRRRAGWVASTLLFVLVAVALITGFLHATGLLRSVGGITAMQVHVGSSLVALPLAAWHVLARPVRPRATDLSRRTFVRSGALLAGSALAYAAVEGITRAASLPGRRRRFTGSYETGSLRPEHMPVTQWLNDRVPAVEASDWRLSVRDAKGRVKTWSYDELLGFDDRSIATLDCTGGWYAEQDWQGVWLTRLLPAEATGRSVSVRSVTGYARRYPLGDAKRLLVATRVGGEPLSSGHGFPVRIVAPGRRGFWWVKWVSEIAVEDTPWWLQPPFPLT